MQGAVRAAARPGQDTSTMRLKLRMKNRAKRALRRLFEVGQRLGVDILPHHFYSEIPDTQSLRNSDEWKAARSLKGIRGAETPAQFEFVESCCSADVVSFLAQSDVHGQAIAANGEGGFGKVEANFLHGFIRTVRPGKIVQIGCGVSTAVMLDAASRIAGYRPEVTCIEPYPTEFLTRAAQKGNIRLLKQFAQMVPIETLTELGENGLLFIDSTHTVKPGSEVNRLIFEVLPRLARGSWVHFHDIYFPYDYQRGLLDDELFFANETALLYAFLINNNAFTIRASLSMLHYSDPSRLGLSLPGYQPGANDYGLRASAGDFPSSIYLQVDGR